MHEIANQQGYKFDILVAPPHSPKLLESYANAINVLRSIKDASQIIEEKEINQYLSHAIDSIKPLEGFED